MRLIDADTKLTVLMHDEEWYTEEMTVDDLISKFADETPPIIDAVPVIRCKDCIYYQENYMGRMVCFDSGMVRNSNDFCSRAERKEE